MDIIIVLIPISIVLVLLALRALSWSIDSGQFDDLDREAQRILFEERGAPKRDAAGVADDDEEAPGR